MDTLIQLPVISATQLKLHQNCAKLYYLTYKEKIAGTENPSAIMGSALHSAIEHKTKYGSDPIIIFRREYDKLIEEAIEKSRLVNEGIVAGNRKLGLEILGKIEWPKLIPRDDKSIELRFKLPFPTEDPIVVISGVIDFITNKGELVDHKSSGRKPSDYDLEHDPQFIIYNWAYKTLYGEDPKDVYWHHLRTGEWIKTKTRRGFSQKIVWLEKEIRKLITDTVYLKKPAPDSFCEKVCAFYNTCWINI